VKSKKKKVQRMLSYSLSQKKQKTGIPNNQRERVEAFGKLPSFTKFRRKDKETASKNHVQLPYERENYQMPYVSREKKSNYFCVNGREVRLRG